MGSAAHAGHDGKLAFQSDQGGTRDIREPTIKRSSKSIHLRGAEGVKGGWRCVSGDEIQGRH